MLLVYRDVVREAVTSVRLEHIRRRVAAGDAVGALIIAGEIEQGVLDLVDTSADDWTDLHVRLRNLTAAAAALARGNTTARVLFAACADALEAALPARIHCRAPEGYCHYALDPLAYARAAMRYASDGRRCDLIVGVRSIGTSLSAVVADVLKAPSVTVRARGDSGSRTVRASERLLRHARERVAAGGDVAIVDEGPGATGETFDVVARWCRELGVPEQRIVLFTSHGGNSPLAPVERRAWLASATRYAPPAENRARSAAEAAGFDCTISISAGEWRRHVPGGSRLPAARNFERVKHLARRDGQWWQIRFFGAGEWGESILARTAHLAERSCASRAKPLKHGFAAQPWIDGPPVTRRSLRPDDALHAARYIAMRHGLFPIGAPVARDVFVRVLDEHGREAGLPQTILEHACRRIRALPEREAFICDARLAPHEWIRTSSQLWKVDAVDHGDGFRMPGPTDIMWDYAGWIVEFGHGSLQLPQLIPDLHPEDQAAAYAYAPAYAAIAFGDALLSAREAADPHDRRALLREARFYRSVLRRLTSAVV